MMAYGLLLLVALYAAHLAGRLAAERRLTAALKHANAEKDAALQAILQAVREDAQRSLTDYQFARLPADVLADAWSRYGEM
jgi:hypothetical protein